MLNTLASFEGTNGWNSESGLTFGLDGKLYGTASAGGTNSTPGGVVFSLDVGLTQTNIPPNIAVSSNGTMVLNVPVASSSTSRPWATTNLSLPLNQWSVLATNYVGTPLFHFADTNAAAAPAKFYRLTTP